MLINKSLWIKVGVVLGCAAIAGAVVGGYFGISKSDRFRNYYVTPSDDTSRGFVNAYKNAIYNGANVILTPGFTHKDPIIQSFTEYYSFFKDAGFLLFDEKYSYDDAGSTNVWSVTFRSDLGSIQTGIAMCMLLNEYQDVFYKDNKLLYGMYGGLPFSSVTSFMGGIQYGVKWFNENLAGQTGTSLDGTRQIEYKSVETVNSDIGDFAGGFGPSQGSAISNHLINKDIDILIPVAGPQIWTVMNQIILLNKECLLIGVDSAVEDDSLNKELNFKSEFGQIGNGKYVQFSSIKDLSKATYKALQIINNGNKIPDVPSNVPEEEREKYFTNFSATGAKGEYGGFGTIAVGDIDNGCVGVSGKGVEYFEKALSLTGLSDPALNPFYSEPENMFYTGSPNKEGISEIYNYGEQPFGLGQSFVDLFQDEPRDKILNLDNFIQENNSDDLKKIKVVVSSSTSVLMDSSFSQSCYLGMATFFLHMGIDIPTPNCLNSLFLSKRRYYD